MTRHDSLNQIEADPKAADAIAIRVGVYQFVPNLMPDLISGKATP
jgi:hypothetical protein